MNKKKILLISRNLDAPQDGLELADAQNLIDSFVNYWYTIHFKEWSHYIDFISASIHKKNKHTSNLAGRIKEVMKEKDPILFIEDLFLKFTPARANYSIKSKQKALIDELKNLIDLTKKYLVYKQAIDSPIDFQRLLTKRLKRRNDNGLFQQTVNDFELILNADEIRSTIMISLERWWLAHQTYYHQYTEQISDSAVFQRNLEAYEAFHQLVILRNYLEHLNRNQRTIEVDYYKLQEKANYILAEIHDNANPILKLYSQLIKTLREYQDHLHDNYYLFKTLYTQFGAQLAPVDQLVLAKTAINYLQRPHYKHGGKTWLKEIFKWMQYLNSENLYEFEGTISDDEYLNFSLVAIALDDFKALEQFEAKYAPILDSDYKDHVLGLSKVYYLQKKQNNREAREILDKWFPLNSSEELKYNLRAKVLRVMLSLENGETELSDVLYNLFKFCKRLIEKQIMTENAVQPYFQFHEVVKQLNKYYHPNPNKKEANKKQALEKLNILMASNDEVAHRLWLEQKIAGLE